MGRNPGLHQEEDVELLGGQVLSGGGGCGLGHSGIRNASLCPRPPLSLQLLTPLKGDHLTLQLEISLAHKNGTAYYTYIFVTGFFFKNALFERSIHMRATDDSLFILLMHRTHCVNILSLVYPAHS